MSQNNNNNNSGNLNNTFGSVNYATSEGDSNEQNHNNNTNRRASVMFNPDATTTNRLNRTNSQLNGTMGSTARRTKRGMSRIDVAATYAKEPARIRSLTIAQAKARGEDTNEATLRGANEEAEDIPWYQTMHKLHIMCAIFSLVGFVLSMVSFLTNYWYTSRLGTEHRNQGLFWECINDHCITTDWRTIFWSLTCSVEDNALRWSYYVNRGFIFTSIVACVVTFVLIMLSKLFYLEHMKAQSYAVMVFMIIPVISWAVAIGRYANWQNEELYCGRTFCSVKLEDTGNADCEESFGYSFILGVLCFILHIFGAIFAIARHCFGEWLLQEAEGEELAETTRRVNAEHTVRRMRAQTIAVTKQKEQEEEEERKRQAENEALNTTQGTAGRRARGKSTIVPVVVNSVIKQGQGMNNNSGENSGQLSAQPSFHHQQQQQQQSRDPFNYASKPPSAAEQFQMQIAQQENLNTSNNVDQYSNHSGQADQQQQQQQQQQQYVANDWTYDANSGLEWSNELYLFRDPNTEHLYNPQREKWYDPVLKEWYRGE